MHSNNKTGFKRNLVPTSRLEPLPPSNQGISVSRPHGCRHRAALQHMLDPEVWGCSTLEKDQVIGHHQPGGLGPSHADETRAIHTASPKAEATLSIRATQSL